MFRWLSVIYLVSVTLAGPALCCCAVSPAGDARRTEDRLERHSPASSSGPCCQHRVASDSENAGDRPEPRPKCPCKRHGEAPAVASSPLNVEWSLLLDPFDTAAPLDSTCLAQRTLAIEASPSSPLESIAFPFLTARDILRSLHILRC